MKKILIVRMWPYEIDINNYNCQEIGLAKGFIENKMKCDIVLYTKGKTREEDYIYEKGNIHIYYLNGKNILKNCIFESKLYDIASKYDYIQTCEYDQIGNLKLRKMFKEKLIIYHGPYESKFTYKYKIKCMISDFLLFFNKEYKNTICFAKSKLAENFLRKKGFTNVKTIGVGLDTERFFEESKVDEKVEFLKKNKGKKKYILYIGKIEKRRNVLFLLNAFYKAVNIDNNVELVLVGKGDKKYLDKCRKFIFDNNFQDKIHYFEAFNQNELKQLYECCDLFVLPTYYEIFGMVLLEAMYFGLPILTTENGGSSTLIEDGKNGYIRNLNNINEWVKIIGDVPKDSEVIEKNKEYIINEYNWTKISKVYLEYLNDGGNI